MAQQDIRFYLDGMLFVLEKDQLVCVATDGHRLELRQRCRLEGNFNRQEIIVPRKTVIELSKLLAETDDPITIDILANQVRFSFGNIELTSKVIDGKFPDYNRVIPTARSKIITLDRLLLLHTLQRAAILSERALPWRAHRPASRCAQDRLYQQRAGRAEEEIEVAYEGAAVDIGFQHHYLLDALATLSSNEITWRCRIPLRARCSPCQVVPTSKYVVMPMRI